MKLIHSNNKPRLRLRAAREPISLTQDELAKIAGLTPGMIALPESGRRTGSVWTWDILESVLEEDQKILRQIHKGKS